MAWPTPTDDAQCNANRPSVRVRVRRSHAAAAAALLFYPRPPSLYVQPEAETAPTPPPTTTRSSKWWRQRLRSADAAVTDGADEQISLTLKLPLALAPRSLSLSLPTAAPPPQRKARSACRVEMELLVVSLYKQGCRATTSVCPATVSRPRWNGSSPPGDDEDRIMSAVMMNCWALGSRVGWEGEGSRRSARARLQRDGTHNC